MATLTSCGETPNQESNITDKLNLYDSSSGKPQEGKINVKFSPYGDNPSFQIENSYTITEEDDQKAILEYIIESEYYSQELYQRSIDSMLTEWKAHNDIHKLTGHERVAHTDFDKDAEKLGYWDYYRIGIEEWKKEKMGKK